MKNFYTILISVFSTSFSLPIAGFRLLFFSLLFAAPTYGQTNHEVRIAQSTACVGDTVSVPVTVRGLQGSGAISLVIVYDQTALSFVGLNSFGLSGTPIVNSTSGEVRFSWADFSLGVRL